jgi:hypothetical protein
MSMRTLCESGPSHCGWGGATTVHGTGNVLADAVADFVPCRERLQIPLF